MLLLVTAWLTRIAVVDARTRLIPTATLWPGIVAVCGMAVVHPGVAVAGLLAACPYVVAFTLRAGGGGDVKFAFVLGGLLARWELVAPMVLAAAILGLLVALARRSPDGRHPHAPALTAAAAMIVGVEQSTMCCAG